jgi:hypothetical protein
VTKTEDSPVVIESLDQFEISPIGHAISADLLQKRTAWVVGRANWAMVEIARRAKITAWRPTNHSLQSRIIMVLAKQNISTPALVISVSVLRKKRAAGLAAPHFDEPI